MRVLEGPRTRAPLGLKTTNAKARPLRTPAGPPAAAKDGWEKPKHSAGPGSATARRAKSKPAQVESAKVEIAAESDVERDEREIEYMPPKAKGETALQLPMRASLLADLVQQLDLPDCPEDIIPPDIDYSALKGPNLTRGWYSTFCNPVGDDGLTRSERQLRQHHKELDDEFDRQMLKALDDIGSADDDTDGATARRFDRQRSAPSKDDSVRAAKLLSKRPGVASTKTATMARTAAAKDSSKPRTRKLPLAVSSRPAPTASNLKKAQVPPAPPTASKTSQMRHAAAVSASKTTLGYAKGRVASSSLARSGLGSMMDAKKGDASTSMSVRRIASGGGVKPQRSAAAGQAPAADNRGTSASTSTSTSTDQLQSRLQSHPPGQSTPPNSTGAPDHLSGPAQPGDSGTDARGPASQLTFFSAAADDPIIPIIDDGESSDDDDDADDDAEDMDPLDLSDSSGGVPLRLGADGYVCEDEVVFQLPLPY